MIDRTNWNIGELEQAARRAAERRRWFARMLRATDGLLWTLEEMNRLGKKEMPLELREEIRETVADLPAAAQEAYREREDVQGALDNVFEVQESLFRWRHPDWTADEHESQRAAS